MTPCSRWMLPALMLGLAACTSGPVVTAHDATGLMPVTMLSAAERAALTASGPVGLRQASSGHWVSGYVENASQVDAVRALGVRTVISLVPAGERPEIDEQMLVTSAGLRFVSVPVAGPADLTRSKVEALAAALQTAAGEPVLIHCASANRVGALMALKAAWLDGQSSEQALEIGRDHGMTRLDGAVRERLMSP